MGKNIIEINGDNWEKEVVQSPVPVVVDFYSTECPPCEALATKYESLAEIYGNDAKFVKIFRQQNKELAVSLGITGSPTVLFYKDGQKTGEQLAGGIRRKDLEKNIFDILPAGRGEVLKANEKKSETEVDVAILGGGPTGLTAAIYAAQAKLNTLVIEQAVPGGNVNLTHMISNYPGFIEPQPGFMLAHYFSEQAKSAGAHFKQSVDITSVDLHKKEIVLDGLETIKAKKIIIASGSSPRHLGIEGEKKYMGKGVSYCATCDAKYFEGKHAVVIGGGNSAVEEALFIAKFASKITMVHQFDKFQANKLSAQKLIDNPNVEILYSHEPRAFIASNSSVDKVKVENLKTKETYNIDCDGVFVFVGMEPNLHLFDHDHLEKDEWGYLMVDESMHTSIPDVFAAGDIIHKQYRQITTAVADGTIAAIVAAKELDD
ncbi:MAG: FAD-dependent oxidoreductase [Deltaproteobacteria bacterium]|nr:FAD-dependent oxidoreductase [Deltaproteobacteria bacterium]